MKERNGWTEGETKLVVPITLSLTAPTHMGQATVG